MLDAIKRLVESGIINEDTQEAINEAWDSKLTEARETIRAELREEFAGRYEHDKRVMVEAIDKTVTESLKAELAEFAEDKRALAQDRVAFKRQMREASSKVNKFLAKQLAEEVKEFRDDRAAQKKATVQLENFVIESLAEEISEFSIDKKAVVETKVRLVAEAKKKLDEVKKQFISRSAALVKESVQSSLKTEMTQLKEDIASARENLFGRRIFEAFAGEFAITHLNENKEIRSLRADLAKAKKAVVESRKTALAKSKLVESKEKEINMIKESTARKNAISKLTRSLNADKAKVMVSLLESVQTDKLQSAFDKYLPAVLDGAAPKTAPKKAVLKEYREMTGNKKTTAKTQVMDDEESNIIDIQRLAGLKK